MTSPSLFLRSASSLCSIIIASPTAVRCDPANFFSIDCAKRERKLSNTLSTDKSTAQNKAPLNVNARLFTPPTVFFPVSTFHFSKKTKQNFSPTVNSFQLPCLYHPHTLASIHKSSASTKTHARMTLSVRITIRTYPLTLPISQSLPLRRRHSNSFLAGHSIANPLSQHVHAGACYLSRRPFSYLRVSGAHTALEYRGTIHKDQIQSAKKMSAKSSDARALRKWSLRWSMAAILDEPEQRLRIASCEQCNTEANVTFRILM